MPNKLDRCVEQVMTDLRKRPRYAGMNDKVLKPHAFAICNASISKKGGAMEYGYLTSLSDVEIPERVNAMRVGTFNHPVYGEIELSQERLQRFADNVNAKVRGIDPDIDYDHKAKDGKAAGWVRSAEVDGDKLWLTIEWTEPAKEAIQNKEYRYFSPEYLDIWEDSTGQEYEDVLAGGALTNRPFLKDLVPLNFSEYARDGIAYKIGEDFYTFEGGEWNHLTDEQIYRDIPASERKKASSGDFAGKNRSFPILKPADVMAAVRSMGRAGADNYDTATLKANIIRIAKRKGWAKYLPASWQSNSNEEVTLDPKKFAEVLGLEYTEGDDEFEQTVLDKLTEVKSLTETQAAELKTLKDAKTNEAEEAKAFAEQFPEIAKQRDEDSKRLAELERTNKLMETDTRINDWKVGKNAIPPAAHDAIRDFRMDLDADKAAKFDEIVAKFKEVGLVDLEKESGGSGDPTDTDAVHKFMELVDKLYADNKDKDGYDYSKALDEAKATAPDLAQAYVRGA